MPKVCAMSQVIENPSAAENVATKPVDQSASGTRIFPLPLTPFERYMVEDDRDEFPMTFALVVELSGDVDRDAMEAAVISALKRHPLARARLKRVGSYDHWVAGSLPAEPVAWHEGPPLRLPFGGKRIDLHTQQGFRVDGYQQQGSCCLVFSVHHALADGLGALQFVGDTLALYGIAKSAADPPKLAPLTPGRLKRRGYFDIKLPHPVSRWTAIKSLLSEGWRTLSRRPVVLRPAAERASGSIPHAGYVTATLDEAEVAELRQSSAGLEATINQRLVSDLFLALRKWQAERAQRPAKWLRVTVPTSLRSRADQAMPATNILGYLMLTRHERDCRDEQSLLKGLVAELEFALLWAMGALFSRCRGLCRSHSGFASFSSPAQSSLLDRGAVEFGRGHASVLG